MPVLALGGDHSFGTQMAEIMRLVATDVTSGVITNSGHWVMEEQPRQTTAAFVNFIEKKITGTINVIMRYKSVPNKDGYSPVR